MIFYCSNPTLNISIYNCEGKKQNTKAEFSRSNGSEGSVILFKSNFYFFNNIRNYLPTRLDFYEAINKHVRGPGHQYYYCESDNRRCELARCLPTPAVAKCGKLANKASNCDEYHPQGKYYVRCSPPLSGARGCVSSSASYICS